MERVTSFKAVRPMDATRGLIVCALVLLSLIAAIPSFALQPPRPGEIAELKREGRFKEQLEKARALGNHRIDKDLLEGALYNAKRKALQQRGENPDEVLPAPPPAKKLMPTTGNVKVFALLIDFPDYPAATGSYSTQAQIHSALFGDGSLIPTNTYPYESFTNYYERSSYGQLHFSGGVTLGWYRAGYTRASMGSSPTMAQREQLIKEAIASFNGTVDFSQFNNDTSDNKIEAFIVLWTGPNNGWANFWWAYQTSWSDPTYTVDGMKLGKYVWQWAGDYGSAVPFKPYVVMHEMGHALGLPDYYDYDDTVGPKGGIGGLDMMHSNWGDHNSFDKWVLDWITPTVVASGSLTPTLNPSGTSKDAVVIMPGSTTTDAFREFFIAQNRYRVGNDPSNYPTDGMLIWHVDARLNAAGTDYRFDNSYTDHKLLKLMQADGLDRIENNKATADAAMYYQPGKTLTPISNPSSRTYSGVDSRVNVSGISKSGQQMTATFSIDDPGVLATLTVNRAGTGKGTVTSDSNDISCGEDCGESYLPSAGALVTLTAVAAPGSTFTGWSGGGCSGTDACQVPMTSDTTVTATFSTTLLLNEDFDPVQSAVPTGWTKQTNAGSASWFFTYTSYNSTGGTGGCALGAATGAGPFDTELRTCAMDLSGYTTVGLELATYIGSSASTADVDVSTNGASGPWTNVWRKSGVYFGPQTVNIDLSSTAAGHKNVMLRFHLAGTSIWWVIDDVKVMASGEVISDTSTALSSSVNPSTFGQSVTFTASVTPSDATGNVSFMDGASTLATVPLSSGSASLSSSALSVGSHAITAVYAGDVSHNGSTSPAVTQVVNMAIPTVSAWPTASAITYGQRLSASTLSGGSASVAGTFTFSKPATVPPAGTAKRSVTFTPSNSNFGKVNAMVSVTVNKAPTVTTITSDTPDPSAVGAPYTVSFTVTSTSGTPEGKVTVSDGTSSCSAMVSTGSCTLTSTSAGTKTLKATFVGGTNFSRSSGTASHTVSKAPPALQ
ncbi:MAG: M6 family metalloprotease domain-containing protein [Acidobacteriota bacterium]